MSWIFAGTGPQRKRGQVLVSTCADYTIVGQQYYILVNVTDAPVNSTINLPTLSGNGTCHFYIQWVGTQGVLNTVVLFGSNRIYNDSDSWWMVSLPIPSGNTYKLTYYDSSGNPWDVDIVYPSYTMETLPSTEIPLNNNIEVFLVFSIGGGYTTTGTFYKPSTISDGQCITFKELYRRIINKSNCTKNKIGENDRG